MKIETAFRAQTRWEPVTQGDVALVLEERVIAIANAYDSGWSAYWAAGARLVLELFAERWRATHDLEATFAHVRLEFPARALSIPPAFEEDDDYRACSLLVAAFEDAHVDVVWIGPQHLVVVRDGAVAHRTQPDTLVEMGRAQGLDYTQTPHRHILTRVIRTADILEPHIARFALQKGDRVIIASEAVDGAIASSAREVLEKLPRDKFECVIFAT